MEREKNRERFTSLPDSIKRIKRTELSSDAKLIYMEIAELDKTDLGCIATNQYFADKCGLSVRGVINAINQLVDGGYIWRNITCNTCRRLKVMTDNLKKNSEKFNN